MLRMLFRDLNQALRALRRSPGFALAAGVTLAIGIGANSALFSVVDAVLLRPLTFAKPDRLVLLHEDVPTYSMRNMPVSTIEFTAFEKAAKSYEAIGAFETMTGEFSTIAPAKTLNGVKVTAGLFDALGVAPEIGRVFRADEDFEGSDAVLISDHLWKDRLGHDPGIVGRKLVFDRQPRVVLGVMPESFVFPLRGLSDNNVPADFFIPMAFTAMEKQGRGPILQKSVIARLKPGVSIEQADAEARALQTVVFNELNRTVAPRAPYQMNFGVRNLRSEVSGNYTRIFALLSAAVGLLLLIACANVANLTLTRAAERRREQAIRAAMGASQLDLIRLALSESVVLAGASGIAGIAIAAGALKFFTAYIPAELPRSGAISIDPAVIAFTIAIAGLAAILSGVAAAFSRSGGVRIESLSDGGRGGSPGQSRQHMLSTLVSAQFALTVMLLIGGSLAVRTLLNTIAADPGFRKDRTVSVTTHLPATFYKQAAQIRSLYFRVAADTARVPGIAEAGIGSELPLGTWEKGTITGENSATSQDSLGPIASQMWVTGHYLEALGVPLLNGRMFDDIEYRERRGVVIINESLAHKLWPGKNAVGLRLHNSRTEWETIVGVVGDVKETALNAQAPPQIYEPHAQLPDRLIEAPTIPFFRTLNLVSRSSSGSATQIRQLTGVIQHADSTLAISDAAPLGEVVAGSSRAQKLNVFLMACFGGIAFALAVLSLVSVLSYSVTQRTHEIGIRIALGATPGSILRMVLNHGVGFAIAGIALGLAASFELALLARALLYGVSPRDPTTFFVVPALLAIVAAAAAWIPARRAARVDPVASLRAGQ
jgi:macrolide transport system ATP-binding/permease protein